MANRRFRSFSGRARGPRRQTEWLSLASPTALSALGAGSKVQFSAGLTTVEIAKLPFTIVKTIGQLYVRSDQDLNSEEAMGALGAAVVSQRATTVGITALPDPVTESEADFWYLFEPWAQSIEIDAGTFGSESVTNVRFQSSAQRKIEEGEDIAFIMANASAAFGIRFGVSLRMLIKLH